MQDSLNRERKIKFTLISFHADMKNYWTVMYLLLMIAHIHIDTQRHLDTHRHTQTQTHTDTHACTQAITHTPTHTYTHTHTRAHTHTRTHTHTHTRGTSARMDWILMYMMTAKFRYVFEVEKKHLNKILFLVQNSLHGKILCRWHWWSVSEVVRHFCNVGKQQY